MRSGINTQAMDPTVRPQDDLHGYVNGTWLATTSIPSDRSVHGSFRILADRAEQHLRAIVEEAKTGAVTPRAATTPAATPAPTPAATPAPTPGATPRATSGSAGRKVGDLYASFMDVDRVRSLAFQPVHERLRRARAVADRTALVAAVGACQADGGDGVFMPFVDTDARDSTRYLLHLEQAGLGLPDESYYRDEQFAAIRTAYVAHVAAMFELAGIDDGTAAARVMALETRLAAGHWDIVRCRDAVATYTLVDRAGLEQLTPGFDWDSWLSGFGAPASILDDVVVRQPSYLTAFAVALTEVDLGDWALWLAWRELHAAASYLHDEVVAEDFGFYQHTLSGVPEQRERWKRGIAVVESTLGEAAGQLYVERHFPPAAKERMVELVANLVEAYRRNIDALPWMSDETKGRAQDKLATFTPKIGFPDTWRDYSALAIDRTDLLGNIRAGHRFEKDRNLAKLGGPIDRDEWHMTPQTVNAYYNPGMNEIVFPAAILQPPFFDVEAEDAVNYGAIGSVIGHEIGHGFDDQGSRYDGEGNLSDWWTEADRSAFEALTQALVAQYSGFAPRGLPDQRVNGGLTVGENIGDLGGVTIAYQAWRIAGGEDGPVLDGLTGPQRFFAGWAQCWQVKAREAEAIRRLSVDQHAPPEFRSNLVRNLEEFYAAYDVHEGDALWLAPQARVRIW